MKTRLDQHFLTDTRAVARIADILDVSGRQVLEIGPGTGLLTRALLDKGAIVTAIELDSDLVLSLKERFSIEIAGGRCEIIHGDAARISLPEREYVVANLPYSASSKITCNLLRTSFTDAVLMYQKEFADRMMAPVGSRSCGRLSVMVQTYARVKRCFNLSPGSFMPPPQVRSTVLLIQPRPPLFWIHDNAIYAEVVQLLFSGRRKMVRTIIRMAGDRIGTREAEDLIGTLPEEILSSRPEQLYLEDYATIANRIYDIRTGVPA
ncbi:MAG: 16S ribosomal RNA methyltransferase A [Methanospirillaceae archaeon]|nr:16S ribosomal RNA methyltransferase A [Methanospirillaceae archaeon]